MNGYEYSLACDDLEYRHVITDNDTGIIYGAYRPKDHLYLDHDKRWRPITHEIPDFSLDDNIDTACIFLDSYGNNKADFHHDYIDFVLVVKR